jgi:HEPN domain-containing protein
MTDGPPDPTVGTERAGVDDDLDPADEWLTFARNDLRSARTLLADEEIPPPIPCFHAQQAAEKALKAVLIACGINPPKVHVLSKLHDQLPDDAKAEFNPDDLARLDPWAVAGRHPGDVPDVSRDLADELIALAAIVYGQCEATIAEVATT